MKRFKFRLQTVLEQRARVEDQAIQNFGQAKQAIADASIVLEDLKGLLAELVDGIAEMRTSGLIDPQEQVVYHSYMKTVKIDIAKQEKIIAELTVTAERLRQQLVDASQDRKVVDKLREKSHSEHTFKSLRIEQEESDELAGARHSFRKGLEQAA